MKERQYEFRVTQRNDVTYFVWTRYIDIGAFRSYNITYLWRNSDHSRNIGDNKGRTLSVLNRTILITVGQLALEQVMANLIKARSEIKTPTFVGFMWSNRYVTSWKQKQKIFFYR